MEHLSPDVLLKLSLLLVSSAQSHLCAAILPVDPMTVCLESNTASLYRGTSESVTQSVSHTQLTGVHFPAANPSGLLPHLPII